MAETLRLMCVLAHPDDETLGVGATIARYAAEDIPTYLVTATRGEHGWPAAQATYPGPSALGKLREAELNAAAAVLRIREVAFLDYIDGELDRADPGEAVARIVGHIRRVRPQVVITFGPDGGYGHPDHIAISQLTTTAIVCASDARYAGGAGLEPYRVSKLYYMIVGETLADEYQAIFGELMMTVDGVARVPVVWPEWGITTRIGTGDHWRAAWQAVGCHTTQIPAYESLRQLPDEQVASLWGVQMYYRAISAVNGGRDGETDLFAGLRNEARR